MLRHLDLFSGIGGFALGFHWAGGLETVAFAESDEKCRCVLEHHCPDIPIHDDVRTMTDVEADVITGGFPCQPHSTASRGRAVAIDLWGEFRRVVAEICPRWVVAENVPGIGVDGIDRVCADLEDLGYTCWPFDIDCAPPGRSRGRQRIVWLAHANGQGESRRAFDAQVARLPQTPRAAWTDYPRAVGVANGVPGRMDRLRMLGNAFPPWAAEVIGRAILAVEAEHE